MFDKTKWRCTLTAVSEFSPLTHDQQKAAEAAFRGLSLNPDWSSSAQEIYYRIMAATKGQDIVAGIDTAPVIVGK